MIDSTENPRSRSNSALGISGSGDGDGERDGLFEDGDRRFA